MSSTRKARSSNLPQSRLPDRPRQVRGLFVFATGPGPFAPRATPCRYRCGRRAAICDGHGACDQPSAGDWPAAGRAGANGADDMSGRLSSGVGWSGAVRDTGRLSYGRGVTRARGGDSAAGAPCVAGRRRRGITCQSTPAPVASCRATGSAASGKDAITPGSGIASPGMLTSRAVRAQAPGHVSARPGPGTTGTAKGPVFPPAPISVNIPHPPPIRDCRTGAAGT